MKPRSLNLKAKLSLLCIILAVVPLAVSGVYFVNTSNHNIVNQAQQQLDRDLKASQDRMQWWTKEEASLIEGEGTVLGSLAAPAQRKSLEALVERGNVDSAVITDEQGHITVGVGPDGKAVHGTLGWSELTRRSVAGQETSGLEVVPEDRLNAFGLTRAASLKIIETPNARKPPAATETRGMLVRAAVPLVEEGRTIGTLQVAKLINNRFGFVDEVMDTLGVTCTLFLDDIRISTNVKKQDGSRAIGTMVSQTVADQVLREGKTYLGRAFVVKDWFLAGYTPMLDVSGNRIGILYVGVNEAPFTAAKRSMLLQVLGAILLLGVLASLVGYLITLGLTRPIDQLKAAAQAIAEGDLDQTISIQREDELGAMARSFQGMITYLKEMASAAEAISHGDLSVTLTPHGDRDQLGNTLARMIRSMREVVALVRRAADSVNDSSLRISSASDQLSSTTSVQASSAEETSAAMEEMAANLKSVDHSVQNLGTKVSLIRGQSDELAAAVTETSSSISELAASVQQVAVNAANANQASQAAAETATAGEQAVLSSIQEMMGLATAMSGIRETIQLLDQRSGEIGAIVEVIEDIADQTNLLALNAAIEAARAGEAGRGFAVVADEVRKLAERSAKATKEINTLILGIQRETEQAVHVTQEAVGQVETRSEGARQQGVVFAQIKEAAVRVSQLLNEVSLASDEQARASTQIVSAAEQMANINQEVTGAVGEMDTLTRNVTYATSEQRQGADQVVMAVEQLSRSSQEASTATELVTMTADELKLQAQSLQEAVGFFKLDAQIEVQVAASRPLALPISRS